MANLTNYIGTLTGHLTLLTDTAMVDGANEVGNLGNFFKKNVLIFFIYNFN